MVKHNNQLPNAHFHKWWQRYVKTWFNQAGRKKTRYLARQERTAKNGVRPLGMLRSAVHPPTQRYNLKVREGRGFTLDELKKVGLSKKVAKSIGIAVDHRRKNRSEESLNANVARLQAYMKRLVVFPRGSKLKKGFGGLPSDTKLAQIEEKCILPKIEIPLTESLEEKIESRAIVDADRKFNAFFAIRRARAIARSIGKPKGEDDAMTGTKKKK